jgi:hypothetical protein
MNRHGRLGWWIRAGSLAVVVSCVAATAQAHFLFIRIGPQAEGGRSAEVFFSDKAEAGDPKFVTKIAHTKLWVQSRPGEFRELLARPAADRLLAALPGEHSLAVVGECQYGVLARPKETPFLLRYYPKAVTGAAAELNQLRPRPEIPFEIQATFEYDRPGKAEEKSPSGSIRLVALRNGKPIAGAVFTAVDDDLSEVSIKAGSDGTAVWTPPSPAHYSVYVRDTLKQSGNVNGKSYDEIREFATLAFVWPLERREPDPEAVALFNEAIANRAVWRDFPGFKADFSGHLDGRPFVGKLTVQPDGSLDVQTDEPTAKTWVTDQLDSLVLHRLALSTSESSDNHQPKLRFADEDDDHPLGRLLAALGDSMGSSYRIKDRQITVVNRRMGKQTMTITVLDNDKNAEGKFLPHSFVVHYWDAATGKLNRVETFQERSERVGSWDLPALRSILTSSESGLSVKVVQLSNLALLGKK